MLIAYNNDIEFRSRMYHIQTEDNGIKDGHITTTVFHSGRTLDSKTTSYKEAIEGITDTEEQNKIIKGMMIEQHKQFYAKLYDGKYEELVDPDKKASGEQIPPYKSSNSQVMSGTGLSPELAAGAAASKANKPDILRASQQVANVSRPVGVKSFSALSPSSIKPAPVNLPPVPNSSPVLTAVPKTGVSAQRQPGIKPHLSKAVEKENYEKRNRAFYGFRWADEDLSLDALTALLLDNA